jgi:hypothetical protein
MFHGKKLREQSCLALLIVVLGTAAMAVPADANARRSWRKIEVPGAVCGDGRSYSVFVSPGDPRKIAFDVMGGGACWDAATCYALPDTWVHPLPTVIEPGGFVSADPARSPVSGHTIVYFPYCTGDVHLGRHVARYLLGVVDFYHVGASNFELALKRVAEGSEVDLAHAEQFVMMGYSAGALGSLFHVFNVEPYVRQVPDKVLIADAPGLHFGGKFWDKFTPELMADFSAAMNRVGLRAERGRGNLAELVPKVCRALPDWRVGVLQGSQDIVMSRIFGAISAQDHQKLVYGPQGVFKMTEDATDNCSAWVPESKMHTFLVTDLSASIRSSTGESAMDYVRNLVQGVWGKRGNRAAAGPNYR